MDKKIDMRTVRKFTRICNELADVIDELYKQNNNIEVFVAGEGCTSIDLIDNKGEDWEYVRKNKSKCVVASVILSHTDCGGW